MYNIYIYIYLFVHIHTHIEVLKSTHSGMLEQDLCKPNFPNFLRTLAAVEVPDLEPSINSIVVPFFGYPKSLNHRLSL